MSNLLHAGLWCYRPQYAAELFNNKRLNETPTLITLTEGQIRGNVDAQLEGLAIIRGCVTDVSGTPLAEITVTGERLADYPSSLAVSEEVYSYTDANGVYTMTGLYADTWRVRINDNRYGRYSAEWYDNTYDANTATVLTLTFNSTTSNINTQLAERGAIAGAITNEAGNPLANIVVRAEFQDPTDGLRWQLANESQTDAAGHYTLCCLNPQSYRVSFSEPNQRYITEYYDDVLYPEVFGPETVKLVQVTATVTTTNINAKLATYSNLAGTVTDEDNRPASQISVNLLRYDLTGGGFWNQVNTAYTDGNGHYSSQVIPGRYRLYFRDTRQQENYSPEYYANAATLEAATVITVGKEVTVTIDAALTAKARITGTVTNSSGDPLEGIYVVLYDGNDLFGWTTGASTTTDSNGQYSLGGLAGGTYRIGFQDNRPNRQYMEEFYDNAATVTAATDVSVAEGGLTPNINVQLAMSGALLGAVTNESGEPLPFIAVMTQRYVDLGIDGQRWDTAGFDETDEQGGYQITGLYPGRYRLRFQDYNGVYQDEWYDNQGYEVAAMTFQLEAETVLLVRNTQLATEPFSWPPLAQNDETSVNEGETLDAQSGNLTNVLFNDLNDSGGMLQVTTVALPAHGTLNLNTDGSFTYVHDGSEASSDHFTYRVNDGIKQSNLATVTITILPINDLPVANDDAALVVRGGTVTVLTGGATSLLANDSDPDDVTLTAAVLTNPQHGTLTLNSNGTFSYHNNGDSATSDSFTYRALDGFGAADSATVTITIADEAPLTFSKTVSIEGIKPHCTTVDEMKVPVETTIVYCYTVRNNGDQTITNHSLIDSHLGQLLTNLDYDLAPGASYSTTFTQTLSVTTTNVATWTAIAAPADARLLVPLVTTAQKAATIRIAGPTDDSDKDTIPDNLERAGDIDGDNLPNFLDTDADGDGVGDQAEVGASPLAPQDSDNDGIPDYLDAAIQTGGTKRLYLPLIYR